MYKKINILGLNIAFCFRYKGDERDITSYGFDFKEKNLGIFWRISTIVKDIVRDNVKNLKFIHVKQLMFGVNLIWVKFWFTFDYKGLTLKIK